MEKNINTIGVLGGSGALGSGLSYRLGKEGYQILIGSRNQEKASKKVNEIKKFYNGKIELKKIVTKGDRVLNRRTSDIGGKGEFVKNIEKE